MSSPRPCEECSAPFGPGHRMATFMVAMGGQRTSCVLCEVCNGRLQNEGLGALPRVYELAQVDADIARTARKSAPLVPGTRRY